MIGRALMAMPADALQRIVEAPVEKWATELIVTHSGRRCLVGHAMGAQNEWLGRRIRTEEILLEAAIGERAMLLGDRYDSLCDRFGMSRVVPLIQARALKALESATYQTFAEVD